LNYEEASRVSVEGIDPGVGTLFGFALGAIMVTFARDPVERFFIPKAMAMLGTGQIMEIYSPQDSQPTFQKADASYSVYWPGSAGELSGRLVMRGNYGKDSLAFQSVLTGFRQSNVLSFTYRTVADGKTGIGSFFGTLDQDTGAYVGTVTGYMHDDKANQCSVERVIALVGSPDAQGQFLALANQALRKGAPEAQTDSGPVACSNAG
jgi:hypothetical protein